MDEELELIHAEYLRLLVRCNDFKAAGDDVNYMIADTAANDMYAMLLSESAKKGMQS